MRSVARTLILIASTLVVVVLLLTAPASAAACSTPFGSLPRDDRAMGTGEVDTVRAGRHECFDRLVVDIDGPPAGYNVRYVDQVTADGSGAVVPTPGSARLQVIVRHPSFSPVPLPTVVGFSTFRSVTNAGSFEGQTTYGLGVRARLPFRVFTIAGGHGRIVVDVAHRWTA
jgi:hypothetical protein